MAAVNNTTNILQPPSTVPGEEKSLKKRLLEMGSDMVQSFAPINQIKTHLCGFAFYANDPSRQVELHHYCCSLNEDFVQCAVYDGDGPHARLIGIEYVCSEKLFASLPAEEQKLWHSHQFDILSGSFIAPGLPAVAERELQRNLINTYGKTWVLWQVDRGDTLPIGVPQLMMVATKPGEWNPSLFKTRESLMGRKTEESIKTVAGLPANPPLGNADGAKAERFSLLPQSSSASRAGTGTA